jgi:hypothetical protein
VWSVATVTLCSYRQQAEGQTEEEEETSRNTAVATGIWLLLLLI